MKNKKKIIISILLCIGMILCIQSRVYAAGGSTQEVISKAIDFLLKLTGSVIGIFTWPLRLLAIGVSLAIQALMSVLGMLSGGTEGVILTPFAILFNRVEAVKIDFFDFSPSGNAEFIKIFRQNIAMWYYVLRFIATGILLAILIYIGIRMAISTVAEEKAKYKKMIVDWVTSLALLYLLHYIIVFVINVNTVFVNMLSTVESELDLGPLIAGLLLASVSPASGLGGWASLMLYIIFTWQTLKFFIMYVKRMMTIGFLILISPLITITYSIDRAGDQKAQALNTWLKEFIYNVLIQPFHCILYLAFAQAAFTSVMSQYTESQTVFDFFANSILMWDPSIAAMIFAILCLVFVNSGEKLIREIFGFTKASSVGDMVGAAAIATGAFKYASSIGGTVAKSGTSIRKAMFPGMGSVGNAIANSSLGKSISNSGLGKTIAASGIGTAVANFGRSAGSAVGKVGDSIKLPGGTSLSDAVRDQTQKLGNLTTNVGHRFTSSVNSLKSRINTFKQNHPIASERFAKGGKGVIKYFRGAGQHMLDPNTWKAVGMVQGIGLGLGMEGSLVQTAMYATVFSSFAELLGNVSGVNQSKTARLLAEDFGKNIRTIEKVSHVNFQTVEEFVSHVKTVDELGTLGEYDREKMNGAKYKAFNTINKSLIGQDSVPYSELAGAFMKVQEVYDKGGSSREALMALDEALRAGGHEIDPRKLEDIQKALEDLQKRIADGRLYAAWSEAKKYNVDEQTFGKVFFQNKPGPYQPSTPQEAQDNADRDARYSAFGNNFEFTDPDARDAFNKQADAADDSARLLKSIIRKLDANDPNDTDAAKKLEVVLMKKLDEMAKAINTYQSSGNVNEVVLRKMVHTHNITAERTNRIRLNYDTAKVEKLSEVKSFVESGGGRYTQA